MTDAAIPDVIELDSVFQFFHNPVKSWVKECVENPVFKHDRCQSGSRTVIFVTHWRDIKNFTGDFDGRRFRGGIKITSSSGTLPIGNLQEVELQHLFSREKYSGQMGFTDGTRKCATGSVGEITNGVIVK